MGASVGMGIGGLETGDGKTGGGTGAPVGLSAGFLVTGIQVGYSGFMVGHQIGTPTGCGIVGHPLDSPAGGGIVSGLLVGILCAASSIKRRSSCSSGVYEYFCGTPLALPSPDSVSSPIPKKVYRSRVFLVRGTPQHPVTKIRATNTRIILRK